MFSCPPESSAGALGSEPTGNLLKYSTTFGPPTCEAGALDAGALEPGTLEPPSVDTRGLGSPGVPMLPCVFFRRRSRNQSRPSKIARPATPPTTPPAMAPVFEDEDELLSFPCVSAGDVSVLVGVTSVALVAVLDAVGDGTDEGVPVDGMLANDARCSYFILRLQAPETLRTMIFNSQEALTIAQGRYIIGAAHPSVLFSESLGPISATEPPHGFIDICSAICAMLVIQSLGAVSVRWAAFHVILIGWAFCAPWATGAKSRPSSAAVFFGIETRDVSANRQPIRAT